MKSLKTVVAPREIKDQIERGSRVFGCEASGAYRLGEDITFCEIHYGKGISSWLQLAYSNLDSLTEALKRSFSIGALLEQELLEVHWDTPVPFALLARSLHEYEQHGVGWSCEPDAVSGNSEINRVYLSSDKPTSVLSSNKMDEALSYGIEVSTIEWNKLDEIASQFLLSEKTLDGL